MCSTSQFAWVAQPLIHYLIVMNADHEDSGIVQGPN